MQAEGQTHSFCEFQYFTGVTKIVENCFNRAGLRQIILPESLEVIEAHALAVNSLSEVTIPSSCTYIGKGILEANSIDVNVIFKAAVPPAIEEEAFSNRTYKKKITLYVPDESVETYKNKWAAYASSIFPVIKYHP